MLHRNLIISTALFINCLTNTWANDPHPVKEDPDILASFFAGSDLFDINLIKEIQTINPSKLISSTENPKAYAIIKAQIQVEIHRLSGTQDPQVQNFIHWMQERISNNAPLSYNDKLYTIACGHTATDLLTTEKRFLDLDLSGVCKSPQDALALDNSKHLDFRLSTDPMPSSKNPLTEKLSHEVLFWPIDTIGEIGLVPLIQLILQNTYPIALYPAKAHGIDFSAQGFGLHDYTHFEDNTYFANLTELYHALPQGQELATRANQFLIDFTNYYSDTLLSKNQEDIGKARRVIVGLFIALHERGDNLEEQNLTHSFAQDLINVLRLTEPIPMNQLFDFYFKTSPIDGRILTDIEQLKKDIEEYWDTNIKSITISEDHQFVIIQSGEGETTKEQFLPTNYHYYNASKDYEGFLTSAGIKDLQQPLTPDLTHEESYERFRSNTEWLIQQAEGLLNELAEELIQFETKKGYTKY